MVILDWLYEYWLPVPDFKYYEGSSWGRIRSLDHYSKNGRLNKGKILKPTKLNSGYLQVCLHNEKKQQKFCVQQVICKTFILNTDNLPQVNHKDENKENNAVWNLEWCDSKYNINYGTALKRGMNTRNKNKTSNSEKPVIQLSKTGKFLNKYVSENEASRQTGVCQGDIWRCVNGLRKSAGGFIWKYLDSPEAPQ